MRTPEVPKGLPPDEIVHRLIRAVGIVERDVHVLSTDARFAFAENRRKADRRIEASESIILLVSRKMGTAATRKDAE